MRTDELTPLNGGGSLNGGEESSYNKASDYKNVQNAESSMQNTTSSAVQIVKSNSSEENSDGDYCPTGRMNNAFTLLAILLLGDLISSADATLIMVAAGRISSEFEKLHESSWLFTAYSLGLCVAQPMYGKLSDIYGRKIVLLVAYFLFAVGCLICGLGLNLWVVVTGRAISGVGGAGIMAVGSVLITDVVPKREVGSWRAYANIFMSIGRSLGGPLGGLLTDSIGWRWLFILQVPLMALGFILVLVLLKNEQTTVAGDEIGRKRIDWLGASLLASAILAIVIVLDRGGTAFAWLSWQAITLIIFGITLSILFVLVEFHVAREPIFDLRILRRPNVAVSYMLGSLQIMAQVGITFAVPLYFQVTQNSSITTAGLHLLPAVVGNTIGGLFAGSMIKRTGRFKAMGIVAGISAAIGYVLLILCWKSHITTWESMYIIPAGVGTGIAAAAGFVAMSSQLEQHEMAMATAGYFFVFSFAMSIGATVSNAALGVELRYQLQKRLHGPGSKEIVQGVISDVSFIANLTGSVRKIVVNCYVAGLERVYCKTHRFLHKMMAEI
ncbi:unnamed protein product [Penicillium pancosmium]